MREMPWTVADFFSCGGGASAGFARRPEFRIAAAVDLELAKPSGGQGASDCNATYQANHAVVPMNRDMMTLDPAEFAEAAGLSPGQLTVMISCAPCTHLSRANPHNHLADRPENSLIGRSGTFAAHLLPEIFLMENARELIMGNYRHHHAALVGVLQQAGYHVRSGIHFLDRFGLPQVRERALVVASRIGEARTLEDLWQGWSVRPEATTVRSALRRLAEWKEENPDDPEGDAVPGMGSAVLKRLAATPRDGGGWVDVARDPKTRPLLTNDCLRRWNAGDLGSHPDVYGRMAPDKPAPTIKRECGHVGNGRYAHPVQDRLLTVREMATLQGFPFDYRFPARAVTNRYRHIGDAVPPMIAFQMSALVKWMKTGVRPEPPDFVMPPTALRVEDVVPARPVMARLVRATYSSTCRDRWPVQAGGGP
jgi:DNA (cytosine-5)-methyltransferase 1